MDFKLAVTGTLPDEIDIDLDAVKEAMADTVHEALKALGRGIEPTALFIQMGAGTKVNIITVAEQPPVPPSQIVTSLPERKLIGPPHAHRDGPCSEACYEAPTRERRAGRWED